MAEPPHQSEGSRNQLTALEEHVADFPCRVPARLGGIGTLHERAGIQELKITPGMGREGENVVVDGRHESVRKHKNKGVEENARVHVIRKRCLTRMCGCGKRSGEPPPSCAPSS
jgi:hypothetical protein